MFKLVLANEILSEATLVNNVLSAQTEDVVVAILNRIANYPYTILNKQYRYSICISDDMDKFTHFVYEQNCIDKCNSEIIFLAKDFVPKSEKLLSDLIMKINCYKKVNEENEKEDYISISIFINNDNISLKELEYTFEKGLSIASKSKE